MKWVQHSVLCFTLPTLLVTACGDDDGPPMVPDPPDPPVFEAVEIAVLEVNELRAEVLRSCETGNVYRRNEPVSGLYNSGLWLGGLVDGEAHVNVVWVGGARFSNYTTQVSPPLGEEHSGPYLVTPEHLSNERNVFPVDLGFPVTPSKTPGLYGDAMVWSRFRNEPTSPQSPETSSPLPGFEGTMSVFAWDENSYDDVLFYRWEITNTSETPWQNALCGFYADTDLDGSANATGYLPEGISYTRTDEPMDAVQWVSGLAFLETPIGGSVYAHRPMYKNAHDDYGENVNRPEQMLWALQGLTNSGTPMIDPSTGKETRYAFSGNPFTGSGWVQDSFIDRRGMISSGPFDVDPGETITVSAVWAMADGVNLAAAINDLRAVILGVRDSKEELFEIWDGR